MEQAGIIMHSLTKVSLTPNMAAWLRQQLSFKMLTIPGENNTNTLLLTV
jgi:hypothetical protein